MGRSRRPRSWLAQVMLLAGDVHTNPSPASQETDTTHSFSTLDDLGIN